MNDKEKIALSVAGGLATLALGYLVWRHENAISQAQASQQSAQQAANDQAYAQQLQQSLMYGAASQSTPYSYGNASSPEYSANGGIIASAGGATNSDIAAILSAFFPQQGAAGSGTVTTGTTGATGTGTGTSGTGSTTVTTGTGTGITPVNIKDVTGRPIPVSPILGGAAPPSAPVTAPVGGPVKRVGAAA